MLSWIELQFSVSLNLNFREMVPLLSSWTQVGVIEVRFRSKVNQPDSKVPLA